MYMHIQYFWVKIITIQAALMVVECPEKGQTVMCYITTGICFLRNALLASFIFAQIP